MGAPPAEAARCGRAGITTNDAGVVHAETAAAHAQNAGSASELAAIDELYARWAPADDGERFKWVVDGRLSGQQARAPAAEAASEPVAPHRLQAFDMVVDVVHI